ncbi:MAG: MFS transporter [Phycisphaeraceae bacterium]
MSRTKTTFLALAATHALVDCFGGVWPIFKFRAGLDLQIAGMLATVTLFIGASLQPLFGIWADHGHQRLFVILGGALSALGFLFGSVALVFANSTGDGANWTTLGYVTLFALLLLVRIGQALFHPPGVSLAGNLNPHKRATWVTAFVATGLFGFAFSHLLFSASYDWFQGGTHWMLIPAALIVIAAIIWLRPTHAATRRRIEWREIGEALHEVRGPLFSLFIVQSLMAAAMLGVIFLIPEFTESVGYPRWLSVGGAFSLYILGAVIVMVPAGMLADRFGRKRVLVALLALAIVSHYAWVFLPTWFAVPVPVFCFLCLASGAFCNTANAVTISLGQHMAPKHASAISGILMGLSWACGSWGQWAVGALASRESIGYAGALAIIGVVMLPSLLLAMRLKDDREREGGEVGVDVLAEPSPLAVAMATPGSEAAPDSTG